MTMNRRDALWGFSALAAAQGLPLAALAQETKVVDMTLGDPDAPVEMIEYASFTCPHCASFHAGTFKSLKSDYIDTGKVRFIYREVYFDRYGLWAGMVARCAGDTRYFGIVDLLYAQQREWVQGSPADVAEALRKIGKTAGMTEADLDACFSDQAKAEALVAAFEANTQKHEIEATPSFVIDGKTHRNMSWNEMSALLDELVAAAG